MLNILMRSPELAQGNHSIDAKDGNKRSLANPHPITCACRKACIFSFEVPFLLSDFNQNYNTSTNVIKTLK
jgi:hypothetical protein